MDLIRFSIDNPVKVTVGVILVLLFGAISLNAIPIQLTPDIERPVVTVRTEWPGRSPEEIENSILIEQEEKLKTLQGLYKMISTAELGRANITLEFNLGYDMSRALQEVANRLDEVRAYPVDVRRPVTRASDTASDDAVAYCLLQAEDPDFDVAHFYDSTDRFLKPALERIPGVAEIGIFGGREHQLQVRFDPVALAQRGISVTELRSALQSDNLNESAGDMASGRQDVRFRVVGQFDSLDPLRQTIVKYDDRGVPIRVADIAEVELALQKPVYFAQCKGTSSMTMYIRREVGANVLELMGQVRQVIEELNAPGGILRSYKNDRYGLRLRLVVDDTYYIHRAVGLVRENLLLGGGLAVLVLLLFLRSPRPTLIVAIAIPISIVGTFVVMALTGRNINVISLAGLSFAVGMVVDNAIVVLENIDRHLALGERPRDAAYRGAREVWGAILASTLTTIAVFAPVLTIQDETGQLFYDIALAICAAVMLSLLVSISVIPAAAATFLRPRRSERGPVFRAVHSLFGIAPLLSWCTDAFSRAIYWMAHPSLAGMWLRVVVVATITGAAFVASRALMLPASYLPDGNKNLTFAQIFTPPGYSLEQNASVARRVEQEVQPYWEAETSEQAAAIAPLVDTQTGQPIVSVPPLDEYFFTVSRGRVFMLTTSKDPENVKPVKDILKRAMGQIPGSHGYASQRSIFGRNAGGSNSVEVEVAGTDMQRLIDSAAYLQEKLWNEFSKFDVRSDPMSFSESGPERRIVIDQVRAKELGLNVQDFAVSMRAMVDGAIAGDFSFEGHRVDARSVGRSSPGGDRGEWAGHGLAPGRTGSLRRRRRVAVDPPGRTAASHLVHREPAGDDGVGTGPGPHLAVGGRVAIDGRDDPRRPGEAVRELRQADASPHVAARTLGRLERRLADQRRTQPSVPGTVDHLSVDGGPVREFPASVRDPVQRPAGHGRRIRRFASGPVGGADPTVGHADDAGVCDLDRRRGQQCDSIGSPGAEFHAGSGRGGAGRARAAAAARGDSTVGQDANPPHPDDDGHQRVRHVAPGARSRCWQRIVPRPGRRGRRRLGLLDLVHLGRRPIVVQLGHGRPGSSARRAAQAVESPLGQPAFDA